MGYKHIMNKSQFSSEWIKKNVQVHSSSFIDEQCKIGSGTRIWHFSHIMEDSEIGENCIIGQNVVVSPQVKLGRNVKVQNNVSIYTGVICEDDVFLGPAMVFTNVINPRSQIFRKNEFRPTFIRRGATIGANATIICGHEIGRYAFIGAGAVVTKNVPAYALIVGNPGKTVGWMCQCGLKLQFHRMKASCSCGNKYKLVRNQVVPLNK